MSSTYIGSLNSSYISIISNLMTIERQPLEQMQSRRDSITLQRDTYTTSRNKLDALQDSLQAMISTDAFYNFKMGRTSSIVPSDPDATVLSASPSSTAVPGKYSVEVTELALAQRYSSAAQTGTDVPLGYNGTFWLGGTGSATASISSNPTGNLAAANSSAVLEGWTELGSSTYRIEVADFDGVLKFRIKDIDGTTVGIKNQSAGVDSLSTSWQEATAGATIDTGRGFSFTFGGTLNAGSSLVEYTAAGTSVEIEESDTLVEIASKINNADQSYGREIEATIVDKQLILSAANTGVNHTMIFTDGIGLGFAALQNARDASFSVNGISLTRSSNENLTNVISGITLNLASDSEGKSAVLNVQSSDEPAREAIQSFLDNFNAVQSFIAEKTAVTKNTDGNKTTYTRGALASDLLFNDLRSNLYTSFLTSQDNEGSFGNLREIGITINDSLKASITDSDKLAEALTRDFDSVVALLDSVLSELDVIISRFTGSETSDGYLENALDTFNDQINDLNSEIEEENDSLYAREEYYIQQFAEVQSQMTMLSYMQQQWSQLYGGTNSFY